MRGEEFTSHEARMRKRYEREGYSPFVTLPLNYGANPVIMGAIRNFASVHDHDMEVMSTRETESLKRY